MTIQLRGVALVVILLAALCACSGTSYTEQSPTGSPSITSGATVETSSTTVPQGAIVTTTGAPDGPLAASLFTLSSDLAKAQSGINALKDSRPQLNTYVKESRLAVERARGAVGNSACAVTISERDAVSTAAKAASSLLVTLGHSAANANALLEALTGSAVAVEGNASVSAIPAAAKAHAVAAVAAAKGYVTQGSAQVAAEVRDDTTLVNRVGDYSAQATAIAGRACP